METSKYFTSKENGQIATSSVHSRSHSFQGQAAENVILVPQPFHF